jgi:periplasmic divalent cation tolerance protein
MIEIHTTCPNLKNARALADGLLEEKLAACVQLFPIESHYIWKGKKTRAKEIKVLIKTRKILFKKVCRRISECCPYEVPEICSFSPQETSPPFLDWIVKNTG